MQVCTLRQDSMIALTLRPYCMGICLTPMCSSHFGWGSLVSAEFLLLLQDLPTGISLRTTHVITAHEEGARSLHNVATGDLLKAMAAGWAGSKQEICFSQ